MTKKVMDKKVKKDTYKTKIVDIFTNLKILILIVFLVFSVIWFNYDFSSEKSISISSVGIGSLADQQGLKVKSSTNLRELEKIVSFNRKEIKTEAEFYNILNSVKENSTIELLTNKKFYKINFSTFAGDSKAESLGLSFRETPKSNLKLGIELEGGTRLILKPKNNNLTDNQFVNLVDILSQRLNKGGLSGTKVKKIDDAFSKDRFILIESTSSNKNKIFDLLNRKGEFIGKLGKTEVFRGENVIGDSIGPERFEGCSGGELKTCSYSFVFTIDKEGTDKFFETAQKLPLVGGSLKDNLYFYLDGKELTNLTVASVFKFKKISTPSITVTGDTPKPSEVLAKEEAVEEINFLKIILKTGPLPSELEVVSSYTISGSVSDEFLSNSLLVGFLAILIVSLVVATRYREPIIFFGIFIALISEIVIIFGFSSLLSWAITIDLAAIGGLIAAIGTGVDDQIIINDEFFNSRDKKRSSKKKINGAIKIILIAYLTTVVAMIPLSYAGLELIKGFSIMIILGVTIGVLITRPAYAQFLRIIKVQRQKRYEEDRED